MLDRVKRIEFRYKTIPTKTPIVVVLLTCTFLTVAFGQTGTWNTATTPSSWETGSNWTSNIIASGSENTANFNQVEISADTTVNLTTPRVIGHLNFDDTNATTAGSWILSGGANTLTLAGTSPTIFVDVMGINKATTINAQLLGTSGFTKSGDGKLVLSNSGNSISGVISLSLGTLEYANAGSLGAGSLSFTGNSTLRAGAAATVARAMNVGSGITAVYDTNGFNTELSGALTGSGTFTKSGSGTLTLKGGEANTFNGAIQVNAGTLKSNDGYSYKNMTGPITVASGAALYFGGNFQGNHLYNTISLSGVGVGGVGALHLDFNGYAYGPITLLADASISHDWNDASINNTITGSDKNLTLDSRVKGQGALKINGNISLGNGTLTKTGVNGVHLNGTNSYASALISSGVLYFQQAAAMGGSGANITIQDTGVAARNGTDLENLMLRVNTASSGALAFGGAATTASNAIDMTTHPSLSIGSMGVMNYSGTITPAAGNYRLGGGGGTFTVGSALSGSNGVIIHDAQGGTVFLTGTRTYTGTTVVKAGTLRVAGELSGAISLMSGGTLAPGSVSGIGSLILDQALTVNGNLSMRIDRAATQKADLLTAPAMNFNGSLTVINIGAALQAGDAFQLFSVSGGITRSSLTLNLPTLDSGLTWNFGSLLANGSISVVAVSNVIGYPDFPELLPAQLAAAKASYTSVTINPGTYHFADNFEYNSAITLTGWTNFTINADNVLFTLGKQRAFVLSGCTNVKIKGLTIRARYPSATQGRVLETGIDAGTAYAIWEISDGYPIFLKDSSYSQQTNEFKAGFAINVVDGTTGRLKVEAGDTYGCIIRPHENDTWKVEFTGRSSVPMAVDDWLVTRIDGSLGQSHGIFLFDSTNCTLEAVTSQSGGFATFFESGGGGNKLIDCTIECSPVPPLGTTVAPVVSCAADGVHARNAYPGMHIENLTTTGVLLDDCIAIHGFFQDVTQVSGNTITVSSLGQLKVNDYIRIADDGGFFDQATCTAIENLGNGSYRITLDETLNIPEGSKVCNPKYDGDGFRILNCNLSGTRSRAIIAKADNGVISGCTFNDSGTAVRLGSDYWWNESGYGWNVLVENNTILNCGQGVNVHSDGARGNKDITIRNNSFQATKDHTMKIAGCDGVIISGNKFGNSDLAETVYFLDSANVSFSNNLVAYSSAAKPFIKGAANVTNLQGKDNGILFSGRAYALTNYLSNRLLANPLNNAVGGTVQQYAECNASGRWILQSNGAGYTKILSAANGLALGVNNSTGAGSSLVLETSGNGDGQLWTLEPSGATEVKLVNKLSGLYATVTGYDLGESVKQNTSTTGDGQQWTPSFNDYSYATWRATNGTSSDTSADDDKDGNTNLLEYTLAPISFTSSFVTSHDIILLTVDNQTKNYFTLNCNRRVTATDVSFTVEYSTDLITWQPTAVLVSSTPNGDGTTHEVWRVPNMGAPKGFLRVGAQLAN